MKAIAAAALAAGLTGATAAAQDRPACPAGETGDWTWQASALSILISNPSFEIAWDTVGEDITTTGLDVRVSTTLEGEARSFTIALPPPKFGF